VIAVSEYWAAPAPVLATERGIDVPGRRDLETLHAPGQSEFIFGLDQHVNVRPLDTDVHDPEPFA
jgi:hypothetical protein